jgi:hypothetical protein
MKKLITTFTLLVLLIGSVFAAERKIKVSQEAEEGKIPQTVVSNYDADYLVTKKFDKETITNYFVTIFTNKNGTIVQCKAIGKDAEIFAVIEKDLPENILATMFVMDFDKTWEMMKNKND